MQVLDHAVAWPIARRDIHHECGPHQVAGVLRSRGIEAGIEALYASSLHRYGDWMLPMDPPLVLARYGIRARWRFWLAGSFIKNLKRALDAKHPILITIRSIQGTGCLHWISAWGYEGDTFYCYDSQCESAEGERGNVVYSASRLLAVIPWRGTFVTRMGQE